MRVCVEKSTGKLIESQSGGSDDEHLDTLLQNAISAGYSEEDIEVLWEEDADFEIRMAEQVESELTYTDRRKAAYPNPMELSDALVKQQSSDPAIVAEGQAQEMQYYSDCLQVKEDYPKTA